MNTMQSFFGLMARPATFFGVAVAFFFIAGVAVVGPALAAFLLHPLGVDGIPDVMSEEFAGFRDDGILFRLLVFGPAGLGFLCSLAVQGVLFGSFSWCLPSLRRKLRVALLVIGLTLAFAAAWIRPLSPGVIGWLASLGFGFLGFGIGTVVFDPVPRKGISWATVAALILSFLFLDRIVAVASAWPVLSLLGTGLGGWALLHQCATPRSARAKAMIPTNALGGAFRPGAEGGEWAIYAPGQVSSRRRWARLPGDGRAALFWIRAGLYESHGWRRFGWAGRHAYQLLSNALWISALSFSWGLATEEGSYALGFQAIHYALCGDPGPPALAGIRAEIPWIMAAALALSQVAISFEFRPFSIVRGSLYPISRIVRARVTWWGSLLQNFVQVTLDGALFLVVAEAALRLGGVDREGYHFPLFGQVFLSCLVFLPWIQWLRVVHLHADRKREDTVGFILGVILGFFVVGGAVLILCAVWRAVPPGVPIWAHAGGFLALLGLSQWAYWRALRSHFTRDDLV